MALLENLGYMLIGFIIIVAFFLILLSFLEKKLKIRFFQGRNTENQIFISKLAKIKIDTPKTSIKEVDKIAKIFFAEAFHIQGVPDYSQLTDMFIEKNNKKAIEFCEKMTSLMYSGAQATSKDIQELVILLAEIISKNRIFTKDEKKELDKKSQERNPQKKKSKIEEMLKKKKK